MGTDWTTWHTAYDDRGSSLSRRRRSVQASVQSWLDSREDTELRVVSACAGDGRDLIEVLAERPDKHRVHAVLLELDPALAGRATAIAAAAGLDHLSVRVVDAGSSESYRDAVPADLVMMCGVFGNLCDCDVRRTIAALPGLCAAGALVIWTRGAHGPGEPTDEVRRCFGEAGFEEISFDRPPDAHYRVGAHVLRSDPVPLSPGKHLFRFLR